MREFKVVPAGRVYANQLAPYLRLSDRIEIACTSGQSPREALLESVRLSDSDMCWAALDQGLPVAMFGANGLDEEEIGGIWLLASYGIYRNKRDFMRKSKEYLAKMHERYKWLTNFIDEENLITRRWLEALGFKPVQRVENFGVGRRPFIQYVSKRK